MEGNGRERKGREGKTKKGESLKRTVREGRNEGRLRHFGFFFGGGEWTPLITIVSKLKVRCGSTAGDCCYDGDNELSDEGDRINDDGEERFESEDYED